MQNLLQSASPWLPWKCQLIMWLANISNVTVLDFHCTEDTLMHENVYTVKRVSTVLFLHLLH